MSVEIENLHFLKDIIHLKFCCKQEALDELLDNAKYVEVLFAMRSMLAEDPLLAPISSESGTDGFYYESANSRITMTWEKENPSFRFLTEIPITGNVNVFQGAHHYYINELDHLVTNIILHLMADKYFIKTLDRLRSGTKSAKHASFNADLNNYRNTLVKEIKEQEIEV